MVQDFNYVERSRSTVRRIISYDAIYRVSRPLHRGGKMDWLLQIIRVSRPRFCPHPILYYPALSVLNNRLHRLLSHTTLFFLFPSTDTAADVEIHPLPTQDHIRHIHFATPSLLDTHAITPTVHVHIYIYIEFVSINSCLMHT